jgi:aminoglycoside/choline kinase family phosphotransferase
MRPVNPKTPSASLTTWATQVLEPHASAGALEFRPLAAEASFRSFYRISNGAESWILMDSPPDKESNDRFCRLAEVFTRAGLPVARVLAAQPRRGYYLLTDLGERDLEHAYAEGDTDAALEAAVKALVRLQDVRDPEIGPYTRERFVDELGIFREWFLLHTLGITLPAEVEPAFAALVNRAAGQTQCCVHRDYHCRNLLYGPDGRFGIVDFQDALLGPAAYDLASLLRDCYHTFDESDIARWRDFYLETRAAVTGRPLPAADRFATDLDYCAVQRQLKAIGIFARLKLRDGKPGHLRYVSPLLERLVAVSGRHAELEPLARFLEGLRDRADAWQP